MPAPAPFPLVDVAVVFLVNDARTHLLFDYNEKWRVFTLPMTKVEPPAGPAEAAHAALLAAVEVLGVPLAPAARPRPLGNPVEQSDTVAKYQESLRDEQVKRYRYFPFALRVTADPRPLPGHVAVWLTPEASFDCEPVSPTVRELLRAIPFAHIIAAAT